MNDSCFSEARTHACFFCLNIPWSRDDFSVRCLFRFPLPSSEVWTSGAPVTNWVSLPAPESVSPNQPREELSSNLQPAAHTVLILKMEVDLRLRNHLSSPTELWTKADIILKVIRSGEFDSIVVNFLFLWLSVNIQSHKSWCSDSNHTNLLSGHSSIVKHAPWNLFALGHFLSCHESGRQRVICANQELADGSLLLLPIPDLTFPVPIALKRKPGCD